MPIEVLMPALSPTMKEGNIANWLKKEGDGVKSGDLIAEIETDKAIMEVEVIDAGILGKILVPAGSSGVKVNTVIGLILEKGEDKSVLENYTPKLGFLHGEQGKTAEKTEQNSQKTVNPAQGQNKSCKAVDLGDSRVFASPLAKRIAENNGVDISNITGTGPYGRVVKSDVENIKNQPDQYFSSFIGRNPEEVRIEKISSMRAVISQRLQESKQNVPHFYLNAKCLVDELLKTRELINKAAPKDKDGKSQYKVSVNDLIVKYAAIAIKNKPFANCSWNEDSIIYYNNIDISIAVSVPDGLITPIVKNADQKGILEISSEIKDLAARARKGQLKLHEFQGGGFSISNLGMYGVESFSAIINPPQACILSVGSIFEEPVVKSGQIVPASVMSIGISVDHRALDGAKAAEFLTELKRIIENPALAAC